jgi:hypothetical protein
MSLEGRVSPRVGFRSGYVQQAPISATLRPISRCWITSLSRPLWVRRALGCLCMKARGLGRWVAFQPVAASHLVTDQHAVTEHPERKGCRMTEAQQSPDRPLHCDMVRTSNLHTLGCSTHTSLHGSGMSRFFVNDLAG